MNRETYTVEEAANILGLGRSSAYAAVRSGDIPSIRIGARYLIPRVALEKMLGKEGCELATEKDVAVVV